MWQNPLRWVGVTCCTYVNVSVHVGGWMGVRVFMCESERKREWVDMNVNELVFGGQNGCFLKCIFGILEC